MYIVLPSSQILKFGYTSGRYSPNFQDSKSFDLFHIPAMWATRITKKLSLLSVFDINYGTFLPELQSFSIESWPVFFVFMHQPRNSCIRYFTVDINSASSSNKRENMLINCVLVGMNVVAVILASFKADTTDWLSLFTENIKFQYILTCSCRHEINDFV